MGLFRNTFKKLGDYLEKPAGQEMYDEVEKQFFDDIVKREKAISETEKTNLNKFIEKTYKVDGKTYTPYKQALNPLTVIKDEKIYKNVNRLFPRLIVGELEETEQYQKNIAFATRSAYQLHSNMPLSEFEKQGYLNNVKLVYEPSENNPDLKVAVYSESFKIGYINQKDNKVAEWILDAQKNSLKNETKCKAQLVDFQGQKEILIEVTFSFSELGYVTTLNSSLTERFEKLIEWDAEFNEDIPKKQIEERVSNIEFTINKKEDAKKSKTLDEYMRNNIMIK